MKLTIDQKDDITFKIFANGKEYIVNGENPTASIDTNGTNELIIEETDERNKLTFFGAVLYVLTQIFIAIARVLFLIQPDWRENVDPFLLKCKVDIPNELTEVKLKYNEGVYYKKNNKFYEPTLIPHTEGVFITMYSKPNYKAVRNTYIAFVVNYVIIGVLAIGLLSLLLTFPSEPLNLGVVILTWVIIVVIMLVIVGVLLYNREKYAQMKEMLKEYEGDFL